MPQRAIFGFWDLDTNEYLILNYLLLIFKMYNCNARTCYFSISHLLVYAKGIKDTKKKICENNAKGGGVGMIKKEMEKCFNKLTEVT